MPVGSRRTPSPKAFVSRPPPRPVFRRAPVYVPKQPPAGAPPNPRRVRLARDTSGRALLDLFTFFPDLPRPAWVNRRASRRPGLTAAFPALARALRRR
jgi:hypothetical protein